MGARSKRRMWRGGRPAGWRDGGMAVLPLVYLRAAASEDDVRIEKPYSRGSRSGASGVSGGSGGEVDGGVAMLTF